MVVKNSFNKINRNGVNIQGKYDFNIKIAKQTLQICRDKIYTSQNNIKVDLSSNIDYAVSNTIFYSKDTNIQVDHLSVEPTVEVTNEKTDWTAKRLIDIGKNNIVALSFANAHTYGGGFTVGASAQEEDLCRASALYPCLKRQSKFYNDNILSDTRLYTNGILYSPDVPFFHYKPVDLLLDNPYLLSIITSPAPNLRNITDEIEPELYCNIINSRIDKILKVAHFNGHKNIILGAWGCGAFCNNPEIIAKAFKIGLTNNNFFEYVCFAIYDTSIDQYVINTFKEVFSVE